MPYYGSAIEYQRQSLDDLKRRMRLVWDLNGPPSEVLKELLIIPTSFEVFTIRWLDFNLLVKSALIAVEIFLLKVPTWNWERGLIKLEGGRIRRLDEQSHFLFAWNSVSFAALGKVFIVKRIIIFI